MRWPYPRLFLRSAVLIGIALAAFVLIGAASLAMIAAWELRGYVETRGSTLGEDAAAVLQARGREGLINWLQTEANVPADVTVYVLDTRGNDLLGRSLPEQYRDFVMSSVIGPPVDDTSNYLPVQLAPQLIAPDGQRYAFLVLPKGISLWGSPATALGLTSVALLVVAFVAWLLARAFSRPISELQLAVRELATGDTAVRVPDSISGRKDELGELAADFNSMADQLEKLISGREVMMREMSHELRSPLARLQAAVALAGEHDRIAAEERTRIEQEIARMNRVIGEMLRYSGMDTQVAPRRKLVRIDRCLRDIVSREQVEAESAGCRIELDTDANLAVVGDPELLESGFENILRNAIRYAPPNTAVEVRARRIGSTAPLIEVLIEDRGPGVPAEHLEDIFQAYFRIADGNHHHDSTGLGLAIVRRVFSRHGGTAVARLRQGGGLSVVVRLPAAELG